MTKTDLQKDKSATLLVANQVTGTIFALQLILLLAALDQTVITTAMPKIVQELGGFDRYSLATSSYLLTSTLALPISGRLSDLFGRKKILLAAIFLFLFASILCALANALPALSLDGMSQLIAFRALQGIGGGAMVGLSFSVVGDLLPPAERGKYQGYFAAVFALASIAGPTLGGYVADVYTWRLLFWLNIPFALLAAIAFARYFKDTHVARAAARLDWFGILRRPLILISVISLFTTGIGMFGATLLLPLFLQSVVGLSATQSGALLTPLIVVTALFSIVGGLWLSSSAGYKKIVLIALALMFVGTSFLSTLTLMTPLPLTFAFMFLVAIGLGLLLPVYTIIIQNALSDDLLGTATGFSQFFRSVGGTLGVVILGALMLFFYTDNLNTRIPQAPANLERLLHNPLEPESLLRELQLNIGLSLMQAKQLIVAVKSSLIFAIDRIYLIYGLVLGATLLANFFLEELPLRHQSNSSLSLPPSTN